MNKEELLKGCPIFSNVGDSLLKNLAAIARSASYDRDCIIFSEGDDADTLYILASGAIVLVKSSPDGREQLIRNVKPGEVFAEAAMFSGKTYPATAIARQESQVLLIEKREFVVLIQQFPELSLKIMGTMAHLLRHLNNMLAEMSLYSVEGRLASYFLSLVRKFKSNTFALPVKKKELAFELGTVPETLSRNLKKMQGRGLVSIRGNQVIIKDIDRLKTFADSFKA